MFGPRSSAERVAYDHLRELIVSGGLVAGTPVLQQKVADRLGISRIPVRDALKHLAAEGLVTIESNRRVVVTNMTIADVREIFAMRAALEGVAARESAAHLSDLTLARLKLLAERMELAEPHTGDWLVLHDEFHALIASNAGMPRLEREIQRLRMTVAPYIRTFLSAYGAGELRGSKHGALLAALRKRDGALAEAAVKEHIEAAFQEISAVISRSSKQPRGKRSQRTTAGVRGRSVLAART